MKLFTKQAFFAPLLGLLALGLILAVPAAAPAADRPASFANLVQKVSPSVVNIRTTKNVNNGPMQGFEGRGRPGSDNEGRQMPDLHEFFKRFFGGNPGPGGPGMPGPFGGPPGHYKQRALGSGVIVDSDGYVLTNNHVVAGADEIEVVLKDGDELSAKIVGRDKKTDLALLKVKAGKPLPALPLGDSDKLRVGDWVLAMGNPFGLENTVTAGIVSAKGRFIGAGPYDNFIQTDASINPGNSGGALINLDGELVGINTAIVAQGQGIGFAIPVNLAKNVMEQLKTKGRVVRGWLGVYIQPVTKELAKKFGLEEAEGVLVADVIKGSPAEKAGVKRGDVIVEYEGKKVKDTHALPRMVAETKVGTKAELEVIRSGNKKTLTVAIGEMPEGQQVAGGHAPGKSGSLASLGMSVQELTPDLAKQLGIKGDKGLVVTNVVGDSPAAEAGLRRGDVILEAAQKPVGSLRALESAVSKLGKGEGLLLLVRRGENTMFVVVKKPKK